VEFILASFFARALAQREAIKDERLIRFNSVIALCARLFPTEQIERKINLSVVFR